ncbi:flagellar protein FlgJ [Sulfuritortus calidifontis]|uniref:Peptidoglycan hydrolase FlgJ n=1 Tax=Sulfuritortus calidifontis TaxID=1914471 RepID=A0A4R3JUR5_9PROT|nr:flagellar assembly peptidoglycan hydrolase FlgJ [Sulfuritortus calidifontis]TCS71512.1 flagellar protein FlgJ [Sulfuritortus calidifontis]
MLPTTPALADRLAVDVNSAAALRAKARAGDDAALRAATKEFESMMVNIMLKTMRETRFIDKDADPFGSQTVQLYRELLDQQWARKIGDGRGLGFADMMYKQLKAQGELAVQYANGQAVQPPAGGIPVANPIPLSLRERGRGEGSGAQESMAADLPAGQAIPSPPSPLPGEGGETARQAFLDRLHPHAEAAAARLGVPAEYILAHAALESGWGKREITRPDGRPSHNLFGIKAGGRWTGEAAEVTTTEYRYGLPVKQVERFRAYSSYAEAFDDYAGLMQGRYAGALGGDAKAFAEGLQQGGYATDPRYGAKLQQLISQLA